MLAVNWSCVDDDSQCVPVATTSGTCTACCHDTLVDDCCRLWRPGWTDARTTVDAEDHTRPAWTSTMHHQDQRRLHALCRLPGLCRIAQHHNTDVVCINPFHWAVNVTPAFVDINSRTPLPSSFQSAAVLRRSQGPCHPPVRGLARPHTAQTIFVECNWTSGMKMLVVAYVKNRIFEVHMNNKIFSGGCLLLPPWRPLTPTTPKWRC